MSPAKKAAFAGVLAVFLLTWIKPMWPLEQALHSSLTVVGLAALWWVDRRWPLGGGAFAAICGFVALHCIGARWLYSNVPYEAWLQALTGWSPGAAFGWQRNHFDRLIHLVIICTDDHRCIACPQESAGRRQPGHLEIGFG